jgi:hypothetical protein
MFILLVEKLGKSSSSSIYYFILNSDRFFQKVKERKNSEKFENMKNVESIFKMSN